MKVYHVSLALLVFNFGVVVAIFGAAFLLIGPSALLLTVFLLPGLLAGYGRIPFEVRIRRDRAIVFRSLLDRIVVYPDEIVSIAAPYFDRGLVEVQHQGGKVRLTRMMDGFPDLLETLRALNPRIRVERLG